MPTRSTRVALVGAHEHHYDATVPLAKALRAAGFEVDLPPELTADSDEVISDRDLEVRLAERIAAADVLVCVGTANARKSAWVCGELAYADSEGVRRVVVDVGRGDTARIARAVRQIRAQVDAGDPRPERRPSIPPTVAHALKPDHAAADAAMVREMSDASWRSYAEIGAMRHRLGHVSSQAYIEGLKESASDRARDRLNALVRAHGYAKAAHRVIEESGLLDGFYRSVGDAWDSRAEMERRVFEHFHEDDDPDDV